MSRNYLLQKQNCLSYLLTSKEILNKMGSGEHNYGVKLKQKRLEARLSQDALAVKANNICTGAFISQIENNKYIGKKGEPMRPSEAIVDALAVALDWSIAEARLIAGYAPPAGTPESTSRFETLVENLKEGLMRSGAGDLEDEEVQEKVFRNVNRYAALIIQDELEEQSRKGKKKSD